MIWRSWLFGLTLAAAAAVATAPGHAQTSVCRPLQAQLASLGQQRGGAGLDQAIASQRAALERANFEQQRQCSALPLFGTNSPNCPQIAQRISQMQANLARLDQQRRQVGGGDPAMIEGQRRQILAQMQAYGCAGQAPAGQSSAGMAGPANPAATRYIAGYGVNTSADGQSAAVVGPVRNPDGSHNIILQGPDGPVLYREDANGRLLQLGPVRQATARPPLVAPGLQPAPRQEGGFFSTMFGEQPGDPNDPYAETDPTLADGGSYRTLCVRTCDGYYFPISFSTDRSRFGTDADICRARCPGTETRLFAHQNPGQESEDAVSADELAEPYSKLANALRYRREVVAGCGCGRPDPALLPIEATVDDNGISRQPSTIAIGDLRPNLPVPAAKPKPDEDPDTQANAEANFTPIPVEARKAMAASDAKKVRVVGPSYFVAR